MHDENSCALGGVAGHAGVFSTANDIAVLAQTILDGGRTATPASSGGLRAADLHELQPGFPDNSHGIGFELNQRWYMGGLSSPVTAGHTGYTGTDVVIDPLSRSFVILLTNRVHPSRNWGSINPARGAVARDLATRHPGTPRRGP